MEHAEAVKLNSVERYLLGELTTDERDAFEAHFFECTDCAVEVRAAASFIVNAREIMRRTPREEAPVGQRDRRRAGWFGWLQPGYALATIAVLLVVIAYQSFVAIPKTKRNFAATVAQALPTVSLTSMGTRSEAKAAEIAIEPNSAFGIYVDIPQREGFTSFSCVVRNGNGKTKFNINVSAEQARDTVELFIPGGTLDPGSYELLISGKKELATSEEIARYPFAVKTIR